MLLCFLANGRSGSRKAQPLVEECALRPDQSCTLFAPSSEHVIAHPAHPLFRGDDESETIADRVDSEVGTVDNSALTETGAASEGHAVGTAK
jgi:hypothetical protein